MEKNGDKAIAVLLVVIIIFGVMTLSFYLDSFSESSQHTIQPQVQGVVTLQIIEPPPLENEFQQTD